MKDKLVLLLALCVAIQVGLSQQPAITSVFVAGSGKEPLVLAKNVSSELPADTKDLAYMTAGPNTACENIFVLQRATGTVQLMCHARGATTSVVVVKEGDAVMLGEKLAIPQVQPYQGIWAHGAVVPGTKHLYFTSLTTTVVGGANVRVPGTAYRYRDYKIVERVVGLKDRVSTGSVSGTVTALDSVYPSPDGREFVALTVTSDGLSPKATQGIFEILADGSLKLFASAATNLVRNIDRGDRGIVFVKNTMVFLEPAGQSAQVSQVDLATGEKTAIARGDAAFLDVANPWFIYATIFGNEDRSALYLAFGTPQVIYPPRLAKWDGAKWTQVFDGKVPESPYAQEAPVTAFAETREMTLVGNQYRSADKPYDLLMTWNTQTLSMRDGDAWKLVYIDNGLPGADLPKNVTRRFYQWVTAHGCEGEFAVQKSPYGGGFDALYRMYKPGDISVRQDFTNKQLVVEGKNISPQGSFPEKEGFDNILPLVFLDGKKYDGRFGVGMDILAIETPPPGTYAVSVGIYNAYRYPAGQVITLGDPLMTKPITFTVLAAPPPPIATAKLTVTPNIGNSPLAVTFRIGVSATIPTAVVGDIYWNCSYDGATAGVDTSAAIAVCGNSRDAVNGMYFENGGNALSLTTEISHTYAAPGTYRALITVLPYDWATLSWLPRVWASATITVTGPASADTPKIAGITDLNGEATPASPGKLMTLWGANLNLGEPDFVKGLPYPTTLGSCRVTVGGAVAPLLYAGATQMNLQIPEGTPEGNADVAVSCARGDGRTATSEAGTKVPVAIESPSFFFLGNARGNGLITQVIREDGWPLVASDTAVYPGETLVMYLTGLRSGGGITVEFPADSGNYLLAEAALVGWAQGVWQVNATLPGMENTPPYGVVEFKARGPEGVAERGKFTLNPPPEPN